MLVVRMSTYFLTISRYNVFLSALSHSSTVLISDAIYSLTTILPLTEYDDVTLRSALSRHRAATDARPP
jgi:hypothetical protein